MADDTLVDLALRGKLDEVKGVLEKHNFRPELLTLALIAAASGGNRMIRDLRRQYRKPPPSPHFPPKHKVYLDIVDLLLKNGARDTSDFAAYVEAHSSGFSALPHRICPYGIDANPMRLGIRRRARLAVIVGERASNWARYRIFDMHSTTRSFVLLETLVEDNEPSDGDDLAVFPEWESALIAAIKHGSDDMITQMYEDSPYGAVTGAVLAAIIAKAGARARGCMNPLHFFARDASIHPNMDHLVIYDSIATNCTSDSDAAYMMGILFEAKLCPPSNLIVTIARRLIAAGFTSSLRLFLLESRYVTSIRAFSSVVMELSTTPGISPKFIERIVTDRARDECCDDDKEHRHPVNRACEDYPPLISAFMDGRVQEHCRSCTECTRILSLSIPFEVTRALIIPYVRASQFLEASDTRACTPQLRE